MRSIVIFSALVQLYSFVVPSNAVTDSEIQAVVTQMREQDADAAKLGGVTINYQNPTTTHSVSDKSSSPLFTHIDTNLFSNPTYQAYFNLWPIFHADVNVAENWNSQDESLIDNFLDAVLNTKVGSSAFNFLSRRGLLPSSATAAKAKLKTLWFGLYSRASNHQTKGSSGFEHVFMGELKEDIVDGQHYWARYYKLEKASSTNWNYYGWIKTDGLMCATIQYEWSGHEKRIGGGLLGTSPEFDFWLFTICYLSKPSLGHSCTFTINTFSMSVVTYEETGGFIATTYPVCN